MNTDGHDHAAASRGRDQYIPSAVLGFDDRQVSNHADRLPEPEEIGMNFSAALRGRIDLDAFPFAFAHAYRRGKDQRETVRRSRVGVSQTDDRLKSVFIWRVL